MVELATSIDPDEAPPEEDWDEPTEPQVKVVGQRYEIGCPVHRGEWTVTWRARDLLEEGKCLVAIEQGWSGTGPPPDLLARDAAFSACSNRHGDPIDSGHLPDRRRFVVYPEGVFVGAPCKALRAAREVTSSRLSLRRHGLELLLLGGLVLAALAGWLGWGEAEPHAVGAAAPPQAVLPPSEAAAPVSTVDVEAPPEVVVPEPRLERVAPPPKEEEVDEEPAPAPVGTASEPPRHERVTAEPPESEERAEDPRQVEEPLHTEEPPPAEAPAAPEGYLPIPDDF